MKIRTSISLGLFLASLNLVMATEVLSSPLALTDPAKREINKMTTVIVSPDGLSTNKIQEFTSHEAYMAHFFDQMRNNNNGGLVMSFGMWGSGVQGKK